MLPCSKSSTSVGRVAKTTKNSFPRGSLPERIMLGWIFYVSLVTVTTRSVLAFPQNEAALPSSGSFEVDGFVFDGPADRSPQRPLIRTTPPTGDVPGRVGTRTPTTTTTTTTMRTTSGSGVQFDSCVTSCPVTPEYNPVCGSDNVDYDNPGSLNCAATCGKAVTLNFYGKCSLQGVRG